MGVRSALLGASAFLSGAACLVSQVLWVRMLAERCGAASLAVATVLSVFFFGMGVGSWFLGRFADRCGSSRGLYVWIEVSIAASGAALPWFWDFVGPAIDMSTAARSSMGPSSLRAPLLWALPLLIPSFAMGGTMPVLVRRALELWPEASRWVGTLYAANLVGAAFGVAVATVVLVPHLGVHGSIATAVAMNAASALLVWRTGPLTSSYSTRISLNPVAGQSRNDPWLIAIAFASGLITIGLEVAWTRGLSGRSLGTVYSFAAISVVLLLCLAAPPLLLSRLQKKGLLSTPVLGSCLGIGGALVLVTAAALRAGPQTPSPTAHATAMFRELGLAVQLTAMPLLALSMVLPMALRLSCGSTDRPGARIGSLLAANTLGALLAPILTTFVLFPLMGLRGTMVALAWSAVLAGAVLLIRSRLFALTGVCVVATAAAQYALPSDLRPWDPRAGERLVAYAEGVACSVAVFNDPAGDLTLRVGSNYRMGSERAVFAQQRQGLIPMLSAPVQSGPVLFMGLGTASSVGAAAAWSSVPIDVAEIVPELFMMVPYFARANEGFAARASRQSRIRLLSVDARTLVRAKALTYSTVVGDLFVPWRAGEGAMYTLEHFRAVRDSLSPGGRFFQWIPLYQVSEVDFRVITATFMEAFPEVDLIWLYLNAEQAAVALVGGSTPWVLDPASIEAAMLAPEGRDLLERTGLARPDDLVSMWIADRKQLSAYCANAAIESRARPIIEFNAPRKSGTLQSLVSVTMVRELTSLYGDVGSAPLLLRYGATERDRLRSRQSAVRSFFDARVAIHSGDSEMALERLAAAAIAAPDWTWITWNVDQMAVDAWSRGDLSLVEKCARVLQSTPLGRAAGFWHEGRLLLAHGDLRGASAAAASGLGIEPGHKGLRSLMDEAQRRTR
ncbi:MAG: fused MFS/spermidine synthase [Planctomycetota bacterium]|nr:fused MFS/spermidine synthase [Planctomycetota bacterium]